jgi:GntR family transcriptional regulator/MocR family aminotransferase
MLPWKTIINIQEDCDTPVYLQIANSVIREMKKGRIGPGIKLPGTRAMAEILDVHRKTMVRAYEELDAQGWIEMRPSQGTFTSKSLPEIAPRRLVREEKRNTYPQQTGYPVKPVSHVHKPAAASRHINGFHDGPDVRLIPFEELGRAYKSVLTRPANLKYLSYVDAAGVQLFRKTLSDYLNGSRGVQTTYENIMITRGCQMALYLIARLLFNKGDIVVVGETNYYYADHAFINAGANLQRVPVDDHGIDVDAIEKLCRKKKIKAMYVTSHHHFPTTVTLTASRRIKLLQLAEQYGFIIIEDDYDYDFHYHSSPILPLVSADTKGMVIYIGTLSKNISPAIRTGYIMAPKNLIDELCRLRQIVDTQGDPVLELMLVELFRDGVIKRHMKKVLHQYRDRRDFMCSMLQERLGDVIEFKKPDGGLAIWAKFDKSIHLPTLSAELRKKEVILSPGIIHDTGPVSLNSTRMGFAWMTQNEAAHAIEVLEKTIRK